MEEDDNTEDEEAEDDDDFMSEEEPEFQPSAEESDLSEDEEYNCEYIQSDSLKKEPKHTVFLSQLLLLFHCCHFCSWKNPLVQTKTVGTCISVTSSCANPKCRKEMSWRSQPMMPGTKVAAGNFLLSYAILVASYEHKRIFLFPAIYIYWKKYQTAMIEKAKSLGAVVMAGDGHHDSMGHSAKYRAYTMFCCSLSMIIHFTLVQRNEAGSRTGMEYMAFQQSMGFLLGAGLAISHFISDRHTSIVKHMREKHGNIAHYCDLWHLKKKIHKVLSKIEESVKDWIKPCENHFYWSARSTTNGNGLVISAKLKSFLSHITNKHTDLDDPLFNRCARGEINTQRKWLDKDSPEFEKVEKALTDTRLVSAIKQASPLDQTSSLEGFHSVLNHYAPKMIGFSYVGMFIRHVVATVHFNCNLQREPRRRPDGTIQETVVYPKFKNGEATVRDVKVAPNFDYVDDIFETVCQAIASNSLTAASEELQQMTPAAMNTMLDKQPREEAIAKRHACQQTTVQDVPPTTPVAVVLQQEADAAAAAAARGSVQAKPTCRFCKQPMKCHSKVDCPRNMPSTQD